MFKRFDERQKKLKEGLFPHGEIAVLDMKTRTNFSEAKMMYFAYTVRQLALDGRKIMILSRDMPTLKIQDWVHDFWELPKTTETALNFSVRRISSAEELLSFLIHVESGITVIADFDIKDWGILAENDLDYSQFIDIVIEKNLSFIYIGSDTDDCWNGEVVCFDDSFIKISLNLFNEVMKITPFRWSENNFEKFNDLKSLKIELTENKDIYRLALK